MARPPRLSALAVLCFLLFASFPSLVAQAFDRQQLDRALDVLAANQRVRGSVALMKDGKLIYERSLGEGIDSTTMLRIGSITKVFTATMILQLVEEKKLTLDTKLARFFPQIPNAQQITIAQMLSHTSGIANIPDRDEPWMREPQTRAQMLARFAGTTPEYAPGEKKTYSNAAYVLLGYIIESVTKSTYAEQLDRRIVRKLKLKRTRFGRTVQPANHEVYSFQWDDDRWTQLPETHWTVPAGAGGIASTAGELATFIDALFRNTLLRKSSVDEMLTGKGINVHTLGRIDKKAYSHLGGVDGFSANLLYLPEERLVVSILMNGQNYPMNKLFWTLVDNYFGRPFTQPSFTARTLPAETLDRYVGTYTFAPIKMDIVIRRGGDQLSLQATGQDALPIFAIGDALFSHPATGILVEFKDDAFTIYQGRSTTVFTRAPQQ